MTDDRSRPLSSLVLVDFQVSPGGQRGDVGRGLRRLADETRLALRALERQATLGDARDATEEERLVDSKLESLDPWVARASVEAWDALRGTRAERLMRLYVRLLDEDAEVVGWGLEERNERTRGRAR